MTHKFKITLKLPESEENITLSGDIEDSDWEILSSYVQYTDELIQSKLAQQGLMASLKIHWQQDANMEVETNLPPWDDVIVLLHKLRPLILQSESTNFYRVHNLLAKLLPHSLIHSMLSKQHQLYSGKKMQSIFRISSNDVLLNSEKVLNKWLNAYEYHRDKEKKEFIDGLHQMLPLDASKAIFIQLLADKAQAIVNLAGFCKVLLGQKDSITIQAKKDDVESNGT
jgi:hypothetical protein